MSLTDLKKLSQLARYYSLVMSSRAGSGHPTSCLSAADLMVGLLFGGAFRFDVRSPGYHNNDRLIFSKGHASPLFYSLWAMSGAISTAELLNFRKFGSRLEGHPTSAFPFTEAATGSLGQGLSVGVGMALAAKYLDKIPHRTWVLLGDGEMAEGSVWEAVQLAAHYKLDNLIGILDVNRLGQRGQTMYGHNLSDYQKRLMAFGWQTILIDGHNLSEILDAYKKVQAAKKPVMIIAKTVKGKGISFLENKNGWHGRALTSSELEKALNELGVVDKKIQGVIAKPPRSAHLSKFKARNFMTPTKQEYRLGDNVATRKAYGKALVRIAIKYRDIVVLDGEVGNSTSADFFKKNYPERFFEMFIAEQNMAGAALGLSRRGKLPFVSTFAAFLTRAFDQIRMSQYSGAHIVFIGSHAGVSVGADGPSQMGLEDIAMFRAISNSVVLYPSDAVACDKLVEEAARYHNIVYLRTTRGATPIIYKPSEKFPVGGSKVLRESRQDVVTVVAAGVTVHEALKAYEELQKQKISVRIIDAYSVKPLDTATLQKAARQTKAIVVVEDHYAAGGLGEAVAAALSKYKKPVHSLCVSKMPKSGSMEQLLSYEGLSAEAIVKKVKKII